MEHLTLPDCGDCGHAAKYHGDRAVAACGPEKPVLLEDGHLRWTGADKCRCLGYTVIPQ